LLHHRFELDGGDDELIDSRVLTAARLIEKVKETGSLENLGAELELERAESLTWNTFDVMSGRSEPETAQSWSPLPVAIAAAIVGSFLAFSRAVWEAYSV
jgi:hypothetical protein